MAKIINIFTKEMLHDDEASAHNTTAQYTDVIDNAIDSVNYKQRLDKMNMLELLREVTKFQEDRVNKGHLSALDVSNGILLFSIVNRQAVTSEMKELSRAYVSHLQYMSLEFQKLNQMD